MHLQQLQACLPTTTIPSPTSASQHHHRCHLSLTRPSALHHHGELFCLHTLWNCQFLTLLCFQESNNPSPASTQLPDESQLSANAEEQPTQPKRKRGPHSQIYDSFEEAVVLEDGREVFACKTCKKKLTRKDAVTSSLINHQKSCAKKHRPAADQPALSFASVTPRQQELISASLQSFIVGDQQALSLVEQPSFQDFVKTLNPGYKLPSRCALQRDLFV